MYLHFLKGVGPPPPPPGSAPDSLCLWSQNPGCGLRRILSSNLKSKYILYIALQIYPKQCTRSDPPPSHVYKYSWSLVPRLMTYDPLSFLTSARWQFEWVDLLICQYLYVFVKIFSSVVKIDTHKWCDMNHHGVFVFGYRYTFIGQMRWKTDKNRCESKPFWHV